MRPFQRSTSYLLGGGIAGKWAAIAAGYYDIGIVLDYRLTHTAGIAPNLAVSFLIKRWAAGGELAQLIVLRAH